MKSTMNKGNRRRTSTMARALGAALAVVVAATAASAATPAQTCESGKNGAAGNYASCLLKAQSKFVKGGEVDTAGYDAAVLKCDDKYGTKWQSLETKAEGMCPSTGDEASIQDFLDACIFAAEDALGGGTLPSDVVTCNDDLTTCSGSLGTCNGNLGTCTGSLGTCNTNLSTCSGDLASTNADLTGCEGDLASTNADLTGCEGDLASTNADLTGCEGDLTTCEGDLAACEASRDGLPKTGQTTAYGAGSDGDLERGAARSFTDNGDGTVTDNVTGLMWEKKSDDGSIHDQDNTYTWSTGTNNMDGTIATTFLADLNGGGGFAGYTDWRIPNVNELQSLVNFALGYPMAFAEFHSACTGGCTVTTCSCTTTDRYLSSTTFEMSPDFAWDVHGGFGATSFSMKTELRGVRAVRGGF